MLFTPLKHDSRPVLYKLPLFQRIKSVNKPKSKVYRKLVSKTDPRISLRIPEEVHSDIIAHAKKNARSKADEIVARLIVTLQHNDEFMARDRLMRLIYSKKLAYKDSDKK